jgi:hypothetical protein
LRRRDDGQALNARVLALLGTLLVSLTSLTRAAPVERLQDQLLGSRLTVQVPEPMTEMVGIKPGPDEASCRLWWYEKGDVKLFVVETHYQQGSIVYRQDVKTDLTVWGSIQMQPFTEVTRTDIQDKGKYQMFSFTGLAADKRAATTTVIFTEDRTKWVICGTCASDESWPLANHFALNIDFD